MTTFNSTGPSHRAPSASYISEQTACLIAPFETISHGTLAHDDLALALIPYIEAIPEEPASSITLLKELRALAGVDHHGTPVPDTRTDNDHEWADEIIMDACVMIGDYAPPLTWIGFSDTDGTDLGCWPVSPDSIYEDDALRAENASGDGIHDPAQVPPGTMGLVLEVNERGNATLYEITGWTPEFREIWSVV